MRLVVGITADAAGTGAALSAANSELPRATRVHFSTACSLFRIDFGAEKLT